MMIVKLQDRGEATTPKLVRMASELAALLQH